ncbi:hypothetical protein [Corynebacterium sp. HMSC04H06]|uniref:hypothetical protein n=1 Tax=Corynebacterium sp. HMSC04H06 TaxID=1581050 RepID=UPI001AEF61D7|nr:hypothetical protein [Corynebacterium sp. HMSC04H06]
MPSPRSRFLLEADQAQGLAAALEGLPGVAELFGGRFGEVSLYFPGQRVPGIRQLHQRDDTQIEIQVVADLSSTKDLHDLADRVRDKARETVPELQRVDVRIADAVANASAVPKADSSVAQPAPGPTS